MNEAKPEVMAQADTEERVAKYENTTPLDGLRGLWNLGSTCYANAVWKMFATCDVFVSALMNLDTSRLAQAVLPARYFQKTVVVNGCDAGSIGASIIAYLAERAVRIVLLSNIFSALSEQGPS